MVLLLLPVRYTGIKEQANMSNNKDFRIKGKMYAFAHRLGKHGGMGFVQFPNAILRHREALGLEPDDVLIVLSVLSHGDGFDRSTVAATQIVRDTGLGRSNVWARLTRLSTPLGERYRAGKREVVGAGIFSVSEHRWVGKNKSAINTYNLVPLAERLVRLVTGAAEDDAGGKPQVARSPACDEDGDCLYSDGAEPIPEIPTIDPADLFGGWVRYDPKKAGEWRELCEPTEEDLALYDEEHDHRLLADVEFEKLFRAAFRPVLTI